MFLLCVAAYISEWHGGGLTLIDAHEVHYCLSAAPCNGHKVHLGCHDEHDTPSYVEGPQAEQLCVCEIEGVHRRHSVENVHTKREIAVT
jgi:hypothetical protein